MPYKWNILPTNDLNEHTESEKCKCKPTVKYINRHMLIIHNSYDGREIIEQEVAEYITGIEQ